MAAYEAQNHRAEVRTQAETARSEAESALQEASSALDSAPRGGKGSRLDLQALSSDLNRAQRQYDQAVESFEAGQFQQALEGFQSVQQSAQQVQSQIP